MSTELSPLFPSPFGTHFPYSCADQTIKSQPKMHLLNLLTCMVLSDLLVSNGTIMFSLLFVAFIYLASSIFNIFYVSVVFILCKMPLSICKSAS